MIAPKPYVHKMRQPDPTPAEIAALCREIRATWSRQEEQTRRAWAISPRWYVPTAEIIIDDD